MEMEMEMETEEDAVAEEGRDEEQQGENHFEAPDGRLRCARGGPVFALDLVGPLTSVPDFTAAVVSQLEGLQADLRDSPGAADQQDLSVDELKIYTEEELVEKALEYNLEDDMRAADDNTFQFTEQSDLQTGTEQSLMDIEFSSERSSSRSDEGSSENSVVTYEATSRDKNVQQKGKKKRGRHFDRESRAAQLEGPYLKRVEELAEIKRKQDEDKLAARLHSLCGNSSDCATSTSASSERMRSLKFSTAPAKVTPTRPGENIAINYPEVILCVEIYHPKKYAAKTQEFLVLGSQKLTDLRDNIYCLTDKLMEAAGNHDPSAYFLIEDTFYNDMRHQSAIDYSISIIDWLENSHEEASAKWDAIVSGTLKQKQKELLGELEPATVPKFKSKHMQRASFSELMFRLGNGYLYCHQGNCKHTVVIRDMRLLDPDDAQMLGDYPMLVYQLRTKYKKCSVCQIYHAAKMAVDDKWAPVNPCYFCLNCYFLLHYNEDNTLLYPHKVFDYYHE